MTVSPRITSPYVTHLPADLRAVGQVPRRGPVARVLLSQRSSVQLANPIFMQSWRMGGRTTLSGPQHALDLAALSRRPSGSACGRAETVVGAIEALPAPVRGGRHQDCSGTRLTSSTRCVCLLPSSRAPSCRSSRSRGLGTTRAIQRCSSCSSSSPLLALGMGALQRTHVMHVLNGGRQQPDGSGALARRGRSRADR